MEYTLAPSIENRIFTIRGKQVMFDCDLAKLFEVQAKAMNQAVKRNAKRFPIEFMFQLDAQEFTKWNSQIVTSKGITRILYRFFMSAMLQSFATWKTFLKPPLKIKYSQYVESRSCLILIYPPCLAFRLSALTNKSAETPGGFQTTFPFNYPRKNGNY